MHTAIYNAFGWKAPKFAHVCLLVDKEQKKLSKRDGSMDLSTYRYDQGVFPETLTNFVALLGWSHQEGQDVMDMADLIKTVSYCKPFQRIITQPYSRLVSNIPKRMPLSLSRSLNFCKSAMLLDMPLAVKTWHCHHSKI